LSQRKKWAKGTYTFTNTNVNSFYSYYSSSNIPKTLSIPMNLNFVPNLIIIDRFSMYETNGSYEQIFYAINNLNILSSIGYVQTGNDFFLSAFMCIKDISSKSFTLSTYRKNSYEGGQREYRCKAGESFTWYAYE
ncbi:hypothetical protein Q3304_20825, partial [Clostridioides sp. GD02377]